MSGLFFSGTGADDEQPLMLSYNDILSGTLRNMHLYKALR